MSSVSLVNVLEDELEELDIMSSTEMDSVDLEFRGFEVKTVKVTIA